MKNLENFCKIAQEKIKSFSKGQILFFCKEFAGTSLSIEDRKEFRKLLIQQMKAQDFYQNQNFYKKKEFCLDSLLEIGSRPKHPLLSISISHCKNLACFVFSPKSETSCFSIGLDIEETKRVSQQIISRISSLKEQNSSPNPSLLWTAKEASLKCFAQDQKTLLLSECHISDWFVSDLEKSQFEKTYLFKAESKNKKAMGFACSIDSLTLAYTET